MNRSNSLRKNPTRWGVMFILLSNPDLASLSIDVVLTLRILAISVRVIISGYGIVFLHVDINNALYDAMQMAYNCHSKTGALCVTTF
jgi:hypothetical protein